MLWRWLHFLQRYVCSIRHRFMTSAGSSFLNELWIISMRDDFLLRLAKYYYMEWTFNLIAGQDVSSRPHHFNPIHWNNRYQVFYLWLLLQTQLGRFSLNRIKRERIWICYGKTMKLTKQSAKRELCLMYCMWNWNITKTICRIFYQMIYFKDILPYT